MIEIVPARWSQEPHKPLPEQIVGVKHLLSYPRKFYGGSYGPNEPVGVLLFDEQGVSKTRQFIDAACEAFTNNLIDSCVVVAPATVRGNWDFPDKSLGEIAKFSWVRHQTVRLDRSFKGLQWPPSNVLQWIIVSYGFLRKHHNKQYPTVEVLKDLLRGRRAWVCFDESSFIKDHEALQSKAAALMREIPGVVRITPLNGTPIANKGTLDLYNQFMATDPQMVAVDPVTRQWSVHGEPLTFTQFRAKLCTLVLREFPAKKVEVKPGEQAPKKRKPFWEVTGDNEQELARFKRYVKPWILRRKLSQVLNLPPIIYSHLEAEMSPEGWRIYCEMRDTLVAFFRNNPSQAKNGAVKSLRLAQITAGWLGGLEKLDPSLISSLDLTDDDFEQSAVEVDQGKLNAYLEYRQRIEGPIITWCRFTPQLLKIAGELRKKGHRVGLVYGGLSDIQKQKYITAFQRGELDDLVGNPKAGGIGLNLAQAHIQIYPSIDHSLITRLQSESRVQRRGQTKQVHIVDLLAVGPKGQKSFDYKILKGLKEKEAFADLTSSEWIRLLTDE